MTYNSLGLRHTELSMRRCATFHWGVPLLFRGKGVYNKGSSAKQQIFSRKMGAFPKKELEMGQVRGRTDAESAEVRGERGEKRVELIGRFVGIALRTRSLGVGRVCRRRGLVEPL